MTPDGASNGPVPAVPAPPPAYRPEPGGKPSARRRWLLVAAVAWGVFLAWLAYLSIDGDAPTVREQRSIVQAMPVVHRALGEVVAAAGPDVVVEVAAPTVAEGCRLSVARDGAAFEQAVLLRTVEGNESAVLDRVARGLPADYQATVRPGRDGAPSRLRADAGEFVLINGEVTGPGVVALTAATGCRPMPPDVVLDVDLLPIRPADEEAPRLLGMLGAVDVEQGRSGFVGCVGDGAVHTARAAGQGTPSQPLGEALRPLAGADAVVVIDQPDRYAYRSGKLSVLVEAVDGEVRATVTNGCG